MRHKQLFNYTFRPWSTALQIRKISFGGESIETIKMKYAMYKQPHTQLKWPPILIMHGLYVSKANWRRTGRILAELGPRAVIAVDVRNHGDTDHRPEHTPKHLAADAADFIMAHQLKRIVALGHGLGGRALMTLALTEPELVERAIFVDITPGSVPEIFKERYQILVAMLDVLPTIPKDYSLQKGRRLMLRSLIKLVKTDLDLILIAQSLKKTDCGTFAWSSNPQAILDGWKDTVTNYEETLTGLKPYEGETLLIAGKKGTYVTPENIETMKKYFPNLRVEYLDAKHKVHTEQPDKFNALVTDFIKSCTNC